MLTSNCLWTRTAAVVTRGIPLLWGDLKPVPWVRISHTVSQDAATEALFVQVDVNVDEEPVSCPLFRGMTVQRDGCQASARFPVPDPSTTLSFPRLIEQALLVAARDMSSCLREHDPRIGTVLGFDQEGGPSLRTPLPRSPLFDPPRLRPPAWRRTGAGLDAVSCPFCHRGFEPGYPAMWAGGNLLWSHPACWLSVVL